MAAIRRTANNQTNAAMVTQLLLEPPRETPAEVVAERAAADRQEQLRTLRLGGATILGFMLIASMIFPMGVHSYAAVAAMGLPLAVAVALSLYVHLREPQHLGRYQIAMTAIVVLRAIPSDTSAVIAI